MYSIQPGVYKLGYDKELKQYGLIPFKENFTIEGKIYGSIARNAIRIWNDFVLKYRNGGGSVGALLTGQSGSGKALHYETPLRVVNGWKPIKNIKVGDIIINRKGLAKKVTGVFPQGVVPLFNIVFEDGRTIKCCKEHLWSVAPYGKPHMKAVFDTEDIMGMIKSDRMAIPLCDPVLNTVYSTSVTASDFGKRILNGIEHRIIKSHLENTDTHRMELLKAILKTNTNDYKAVRGEFVTTNELLANDVISLARSLGYLAEIINFDESDSSFTVCVCDDTYHQLEIISIEPVGEDEAICITVDDEESLYIAKDYIVTHNTETAKILGNYAIEFGNMPVILVGGVETNVQLVELLDELDNVVIIIDEFAKQFSYSIQEKALTMFSNLGKKNKIFILTENKTNIINEFITANPGRMDYHFIYDRMEEPDILEYCEDHKVADWFVKDLLEVFKQAATFTISHLKRLVREHTHYPNDTMKQLVKVLNVKSIVKDVILTVVRVYNNKEQKEIEFNPNSGMEKADFEAGYTIYLRLKENGNLKLTKNDLVDIKDDLYILAVGDYRVELKIKNKQGESDGGFY